MQDLTPRLLDKYPWYEFYLKAENGMDIWTTLYLDQPNVNAPQGLLLLPFSEFAEPQSGIISH